MPASPPDPERSAVERLLDAADLLGPYAIRAAATLRIADHIAAGHRTAEAIAAAAGTESDATRRLLDFLVHRGLFAEETPGAFTLTPLSEPLREDHPSGLRAGLDLTGVNARSQRAYPGLVHTLRTGRPAYPESFGTGFYHDVDDDAAVVAAHRAGRTGRPTPVSVALTDGYPWADAGHVVDVGGGAGSLLATLLPRHPRLRGTLVDLPHTAAAVATALAGKGLADRCTTVGGDFFEPGTIPAGADVYVLQNVLIDWGDDEALRLLRRCREAAGPTARVLCVEWSPPGRGAGVTHADLHQLVLNGGRVRTEPQLTGLAVAAGLVPDPALRRTLATGHLVLTCTPTAG
jgi:SAM-dependent methyltransferase